MFAELWMCKRSQRSARTKKKPIQIRWRPATRQVQLCRDEHSLCLLNWYLRKAFPSKECWKNLHMKRFHCSERNRTQLDKTYFAKMPCCLCAQGCTLHGPELPGGCVTLFLAMMLLTLNQIKKNRVRIDLTNNKPIFKSKKCQHTMWTCPKITSRFT